MVPKKLAIIINGKPGVGKDTLCDAVIARGRARKASSIDPIAQAAKILDWDGVKDARARKFLSDLKRLSAQFNDWPNRYLQKAYQDLPENEILFVHIREQDQIEAFRKAVGDNCAALLITRPGMDGEMGNASDDEVEGIAYDYTYCNDKPLDQAGEDFCVFIDRVLGNGE